MQRRRRAAIVASQGEQREERIGDQRARDDAKPAEAASRYEPLDVPPLLPLWLGCILAAFLGIVLLGITVGYPLATHQESRGPLKELPTAPRLQSAPTSDLQRYEGTKARELGAATGPIDAAMRDTVKQGWGPPR
jgi:hypothetical protein